MKRFFTILIVLISFLLTGNCHNAAAGETKIIKSWFSGDTLDMYINLESSDIILEGAAANGIKTEINEYCVLNNQTDIKTTFMIDRCIFSDENQKASCLSVLRELLSLSENETFRLISFGENRISTELDFTQNQMKILDTAEKIEIASDSSDINDILNAFYKEEKSETDKFERLIIFTNSDTLNYLMFSESEEIENVYPAYFVITDDSSNAVFSDMLGDIPFFQEMYRCKSPSDSKMTATAINDFSCIYHFNTKLADDILKDGGLVTVQLKFEGQGISTVLEETIDVGAPMYSDSDESYKLKILVVIVSLIAVMLGFILVLMLRKNRKKTPVEKNAEQVSAEEISPYTVPLSKKKSGSITTLLSTVSTRILFKEDKYFMIILTEIGNPDNRIEISSEKDAVIGRNRAMSDYIIYNERSVSQKHCRIYSRDSKIFVEDLGSLNHTYVDGEEIKGESEIFTGSVLKIGRVVFDVKIIPM